MINSNNQEDVEQDVKMRMPSEVFDCDGLSLAQTGMCSNCTEKTDEKYLSTNILQCSRPDRPPSPSALCCPVGQREGINVGSLSWALLSAQQHTGGWCSSQRLSLALHCVCKSKGKRLPASVSCREQRERESILLPCCGFSELPFTRYAPPPTLWRAVWKGKKPIQSWSVRLLLKSL